MEQTMTRKLLTRAALVGAACCLLVAVQSSPAHAARRAETTTQRSVKSKQTKRHKSKPPRKAAVPPRTSSLPAGTWGGQHISLDVTPAGARLEFDCAQGTIEQALTLDAHNAFDLPGTYTPEHGGPVRIDEQPNARPARYTGRIEGERLTLTITFADTQKPVGTYTLVRGQTARIFRCL